MKQVVLLFFLALMLIANWGCSQDIPDESIDFTVTGIKEIDREPADIYIWSHPSVFDIEKAAIDKLVDSTVFFAEYALPENWGTASDCFNINDVVCDENIYIGLFCYSPDGEVVKVCTHSDCRDSEEICQHISAQERFHGAVLYEDTVYYIGTTLSETTGSTVKWYVLRLQKNADSFEKIFESSRPLTEIRFHKGLMYVKSPSNYIGDESIYYIINLSENVYTEIESDRNVYVIGAEMIVRIDASGAYFTDDKLQPLERCCDTRYIGQIDGKFFYYINDGTLYRTEQGKRGYAQKVREDVRDFRVCDDKLYYLDNSSGEAKILFYYREYEFHDGKITITDENAPYKGFENIILNLADIDSNGIAVNERAIFRTDDNEWITSLGDRCLDKAILVQTIRAGDGENIQYYNNEYLISSNVAEQTSTLISNIRR